MLKHYSLPPRSANPKAQPLVFDWDEQAGVVKGPGAVEILLLAQGGSVALHPLPQTYVLGAEPLKSRADMAALCGAFYELPPELAAHYPQGDQGSDEEGVVF